MKGFYEVAVCAVVPAKGHYGLIDSEMKLDVVFEGKPKVLPVMHPLRKSTGKLLLELYPALEKLVTRANPLGEDKPVPNIYVVISGWAIPGIVEAIQARLVDNCFERANVSFLLGPYEEWVCKGGLKAGQSARENQWGVPLSNME